MAVNAFRRGGRLATRRGLRASCMRRNQNPEDPSEEQEKEEDENREQQQEELLQLVTDQREGSRGGETPKKPGADKIPPVHYSADWRQGVLSYAEDLPMEGELLRLGRWRKWRRGRYCVPRKMSSSLFAHIVGYRVAGGVPTVSRGPRGRASTARANPTRPRRGLGGR
eukprot:GHVT01051253.1.p1 GENE.GHVT01051253.1~~GHVT01051253.1.p1  ORF type:complete len:168 (+),score=32.75 GHVT01051253.1:123-626(+)